MTSNEILKADALDILFDNRNKQYGAYTLRKYYNSRLSIALAAALSIIILLFFLARMGGNKEFVDPGSKKIVQLSSVNLQKEIKLPELPKQKSIQPVQQSIQTQWNNLKIMNDIKVLQTVPDQTILDNSNISDKTITGMTTTNVVANINADGKNNTKPVDETMGKEMLVQKEPEFPGGIQAWINFLNKNLRMPDELQAGEKKTVLISFQVSTEGLVTGFEVIQSGGNIYDNEVIRVLKKMPKWKPAIQNGQPVSRSFTQPVTFIGVEE